MIMKQSLAMNPKAQALHVQTLKSLNQWLSADSRIFSSLMEESISRKVALSITTNFICFTALCLVAEMGAAICLFCFALLVLSLCITVKTIKQVRKL